MSLKIADRTNETTSTTGTGTITLLGAVTSFQSFNLGVGVGNSTYYCIANPLLNEWEVGQGTLLTSTTLSRTTVLSSSNSNSLVSFSAGTKQVFVTLPSEETLLASGVGVSSVINTDGSLIFNNVSGVVTGSLNLAHGNTWTSAQTINLNAAPAQSPAAGSGLSITGIDSTVARVSCDAYNSFGSFVARRADNTCATPTAVQSGDQLSSFGSQGWYVTGGPAFSGTTSNLSAYVSEPGGYSESAQGTEVHIRTTPNGTIGMTTAAVFGNDGSLTVTGNLSASTIAGVTKSSIVPNTTPTSGQILVGNGTSYTPQSVSGDLTINSSGVVNFSNIAHTFSAQQNFATFALTDGISISWNLAQAQVASVTLSGNRTLANPTNMVNGGTYCLIVTQDGTGSRTLAFGTDYKFTGGVAPTLTPTPGAVNVLTFVSNGTQMLSTSGGAAAGGSTNQIQYNNSGALNGSPAATIDASGQAKFKAQASTDFPLSVQGASGQSVAVFQVLRAADNYQISYINDDGSALFYGGITTFGPINATSFTVNAKYIYNDTTTSYLAFLPSAAPTFIPRAANQVSLAVQGFASQTADLQDWQNSTPTVLSSIDCNGGFHPVHQADSAAKNDSIYYSTTASKLVYKDSGGTVNNLY